MKIDRDEAKRIAGLAHLEFDDAGLDRMAGEMTKILSYIDQLRDIGDLF
jgi:Asp-tRNA(Asn)/Glu-tRNA(Gln) amidotransferase C subunit